MSFVYREVSGTGFYEVSGWDGAHGIFTTRRGGVSSGPFESLNLGGSSGDDQSAVTGNRARLAEAIGLHPGGIKTVSQVHGTNVFVLRDPEAPRPEQGYDAIITDVPGIAAGVLTADCVPVLLYDPNRRAAGAVHAGWKGTVNGIAGKAVRAMGLEFGCRPEDIRACIGPSIGPCCYEVDARVMAPLVDLLGDKWQDYAVSARPLHWNLDLWSVNRQTLVMAGVRPENIDIFSMCSSCNQDKFFSHRGSGGKSGRMMGLVVL
ncbi:MAG TPA: peptidoglycan editing factor PgeF [Nitrospirota bacterium]|jgi:hypothetical protein